MRGSDFLQLLVRIAEADSELALRRVELRVYAAARTPGSNCRIRLLREKLAERERSLGTSAN